MTQEDKHLLLKDLCARLPHGVQAQVDGHVNPLQILGISKLSKSTWAWKKGTYVVSFWNDTKAIENIKPYLRPMSSMTPDERREYDKLIANCLYDAEAYFFENYNRLYDWLNSHHFDYRGLIEKGLALEAPSDMYKTK